MKKTQKTKNLVKPKTTKPTKITKSVAPKLAPKLNQPTKVKKTNIVPTPALKSEAPAIKSTSQLRDRLQSFGITAVLAEPPKVFVAVLSKTGSPNTLAEIFTVQSHGESSCHQVLAKLASAVTGLKVTKALHVPSGLEFFLDRELEVLGKENAIIDGTNIKYAVPGTRGEEKTLGEGVRVQIFRNNPYILDEDEDTLTTNKLVAKEAVAQRVADTKEKGSCLKEVAGGIENRVSNLTSFAADL